MRRLEEKVAFITGAGAGIAKASAIAFAKEGAKVALIEIDADLGRSAEREICDIGGNAIFIETDVTRDDSVKRAVDTTVDRFGRLDILLNCAGGSVLEDVPVHEMDLDVWHRTIALNLLHPFLCSRHGIPHMLKGGCGSIINVSSHIGLMGSMRPAYAASKGGIMSFTKTLAAQYAQHGIRANAIAPGSVRSERYIRHFEDNPAPTAATAERALAQQLYPFSVGDPDDIAAIAVFLASNESRMLTGTTIAADGGRSSYFKVSDRP